MEALSFLYIRCTAQSHKRDSSKWLKLMQLTAGVYSAQQASMCNLACTQYSCNSAVYIASANMGKTVCRAEIILIDPPTLWSAWHVT